MSSPPLEEPTVPVAALAPATAPAAANSPAPAPTPSSELAISTPAPTVEADEGAESKQGSDSIVKEEEWTAMQDILKTVYDFRSPDGHDASKLFHKNVNKRNLPDYYEVIKEPMALSVIKRKLHLKEYKTFEEFVRDFTLITYNAQVYNRSNSGAYIDALEVRHVLEQELQKLVAAGTVTDEAAKIPYVGEIPMHEDPLPEEEEEEEEEEEDDEDEDAATEGKKGRRKTADATSKDEEGGREGWKKKRGRPPKVDTPTEGRIKNILKGLRRSKMDNGELKIFNFDRLPEKSVLPDYYTEIASPMAVDTLKKKLKRKKYTTVQQFMQDVELMFENAKTYNQDDSQIFKDAVFLQGEARGLAAEELAKPDTDFAMEDGRLPLPEGIEHKGQLYRVGDWIHLVNPNDLTKPIITQIYRTWQDGSGQKYVNACWYYRPEQTVHRFDKHFYENEIVKTGQYRDHAIDEILDRCFVMFITRYSKGRPRNLQPDKEIYVCESRYNEEKHTFNKIKTWASCLPDEVRDKDYEMDMFPATRKIKKKPSPIAYLLKDEQKETDPLPKPEWGADNAPPKIGAVHRLPRDPRDSLPPERTPTPPPRQPTPPPPPPKRMPPLQQPNRTSLAALSTGTSTPNLGRPPSNSLQNVTSQYPRQQQAITPALPRQNSGHFANNQQHSTSQSNTRTLPPDMSRYTQNSHATPNAGYKAPNPVEVYSLSHSANAAIPPAIRNQFQCDKDGNVLFFTSPPLNLASVEQDKSKAQLGHSAKYLAAKAKRDEMVKAKREREIESGDAEQERRTKAARLEEKKAEEVQAENEEGALALIEEQMLGACRDHYEALYGENWREALMSEVQRSGFA